MKSNEDELLNLQRRLKRFANGWIQTFIPIDSAVSCPVCSSDALRVFPYPSLDSLFSSSYLYGCTECGISWMKQDLVLLDEYYESQYAIGRKRDVDPVLYFTPDYHENDVSVKKFFSRARAHADLILRYFGDRSPESVLDFGSGPGYFLFSINSPKKYSVEPDFFFKKIPGLSWR